MLDVVLTFVLELFASTRRGIRIFFALCLILVAVVLASYLL